MQPLPTVEVSPQLPLTFAFGHHDNLTITLKSFLCRNGVQVALVLKTEFVHVYVCVCMCVYMCAHVCVCIHLFMYMLVFGGQRSTLLSSVAFHIIF